MQVHSRNLQNIDKTARISLSKANQDNEKNNNGVCGMRVLLSTAALLCALVLNTGSALAQAQTPVASGSSSSSTTQPITASAPIDTTDPLAAFRKAQGGAAPAGQNAPAPNNDGIVTTPAPEYKNNGAAANNTPPPTAGGFQQPANGQVVDPTYNLDTLSDADIEAKEAEMQQKAREQAFDSAINGMMPMSPDQIRALLDKYKVTRSASEKRIGGSPKPEITSQTVSLEPGVAPPTIKLSPGHVTSVDMMDVTGQPWPVQDVSWGGNFEVISPGEGGHVIRISPMGAEEVGNMSVQLVGLKTPVTFTLETQLEVVQYRFDARIPEYGPLATPPIIDPGLTIEAGADKSLGQILDGVPPAGTERLTVEGVDARTSVYRNGGQTYLRTPLTLLSPGWSASVKSADGMTVYVVNNSPVFLLSDHGKMVRAMVAENRTVQ